MTSEKLMPCPFCGGEAKLIQADNPSYTQHSDGWYVICKCGASLGFHGNDDEYNTYGDFPHELCAVQSWNTRATDALADYYRWKSAKGLTPEQHTQWNMELHRLLDGERHRIADLKQLVRDMYDVAARGEFDVGEESKFSERMAKLGVVYEC